MLGIKYRVWMVFTCIFPARTMTVDIVTEIVKVRVLYSEVVSIRKESRFALCSTS